MSTWTAVSGGFAIELGDGTSVTSRALVLSLGPWFKDSLERLGVPIRVQRNVQAWFQPSTDAYATPHFPPFLLDRKGLPAPLYGFPDFGEGVKAAFHCLGEATDAVHINREVNMTCDIQPIVQAMEQWMPGAAVKLRAAKPCMYTHTPDGHFIIDRHPDYARLILCGGFSGHGFKFAPVVGEIAADLALEENSRHKIDFLSLGRFAAS